jgi:hypothetical protein
MFPGIIKDISFLGASAIFLAKKLITYSTSYFIIPPKKLHESIILKSLSSKRFLKRNWKQNS